MKNTLLIVGLLLLIASTATRIYLVYQTRRDTPVRSRISVLPCARDDAFVFAFQLAGLFEVMVALLYEELQFDAYLKLPFIGAVILQALYFGPIVIGFTFSAIIVKIKDIR